MKIKKIILNNFRAYTNAEIVLDDFNCIIGKNDVGKSTIFAALDWFFNDTKLTEDDFAADGFGYYMAYFSDTDPETGETTEGEYKKYDLTGHQISVEVYFDGNEIEIPACTEEDNFIFSRDYKMIDDTICIKKYMIHPQSEFESGKTGYSIKTIFFKKIGKMFSECSFEELNALYAEVGKNAEPFCSHLRVLENKQKNRKGGFSYYGLIEAEKCDIMHKICSELYTHYVNNSETIDTKWINTQPFEIKLPEFKLYTSKTPIKDYLNELFTPNNAQKAYRYFEEMKLRTAQKLSDLVGFASIEEKMYYKKGERIDFFTENSLVFKRNADLPLYIPLQNRGEGLQLKIKNAVFRLLSEIHSSKTNTTIFAFEEPETHLHPESQVEMLRPLKELTEKNPNYQVLMTTHSPFIVKELAQDDRNNVIIVKQKGTTKSSEIINQINERVIKNYVSMNEINYIAFDLPSVEYHQELFAHLQNGEKTVDEVDNLFVKNMLWYQVDSKGKLIIDPKSGLSIDRPHSLPYCVRNQIDHPLEAKERNASNSEYNKAFDNNTQYSNVEMRRKSIEMMRNYILNHH